LDTAIIVGVIIGSVVAMVLVFGKTVLGVAWTGKSARKSKKPAQNPSEVFSTNDLGKVLLYKSQNENWKGSESKNKSNDFDSLLNKEVFTCDGTLIGCISSLQSGLMVISYAPEGIKYEIPAYYLRQRSQNNVLVDISARDLQHYESHIAVH
jgi:hypothetical protein